MFCKNCGSQLSDDSTFCSNCGYKVKNFPDQTDKSAEIEDTAIESNCEINKELPSNAYTKIADKLFLCGFISATIGTILFLGIVLISLIGWGSIYLYSGYDFTAILTTISLIFMLLGFIILSFILAANIKFKSIKLLTKRFFTTLSIVLIIFSLLLSAWGITDYINEQNSGSSYGDSSYGSSYNSNYSSGVDKRLGLSLKVDSIKTSGNYTYVYCTVSNVSSKYVATKYKYVKVKAQFKNYSGSIVDTDWTYAIDSTWLDPGESKTFYFMVQNTNIKSATLSFVD